MEVKYMVDGTEKSASLKQIDFDITPNSVEPGTFVEATLSFEVDEEHTKPENLDAFRNEFFLMVDGKSDVTQGIKISSMKYEILPGSSKTKKTVRLNWPIEPGKPTDAASSFFNIVPTSGRGKPASNQLTLHKMKKLQVTESMQNVLGKATGDLTNVLEQIGANISKAASSTVNTRLQPVGSAGTWDLALWVLIKKATEDLSFTNFEAYMDKVFCADGQYDARPQRRHNKKLDNRISLPFSHVDAYRSVKIATEAFVMVNYMIADDFTREQAEDLLARVPITDGNFDETKLADWWRQYKVSINLGSSDSKDLKGGIIPYLGVIRRKLKDESIKDTSFEGAFNDYLQDKDADRKAENCYGIISQKLAYPSFLELIWSYWHEESMMIQGLNAITRRFQNIKNPKGEDPLAGLTVDPLRPLGNLLWGYIQDEQHRLSVLRRAYEYDHHYGISLEGAAVKNMQTADSRSKFMEAFHRLLHQTSEFYKDSDDMTRRPDAFPVLNALKEVHLILSEGAHNQYGDLPSAARTEMLMQQWLLARPEFREFLPTRIMVAYPEAWMDRVSALNKLQGWTETSPLHFRDLGRFGEQILLSVRFGNWSDINNRNAAYNWANFWREQIQGYIHAYRAVTGVDLSLTVVGKTVDARAPSYHLARRLKAQQNGSATQPIAKGKFSRNGAAAKNGKIKKEWI